MTRQVRKGHEGLITITEAMNNFDIKFEKGVINLVEGHAGSGKSYFMMNDFINNTIKFTDYYMESLNLKHRLSQVLWVCDTKMLMDSVIHDYPLIAEAKRNGMLIEAKNFSSVDKILSDDNGTIKVISYQTLALFIENEKNRKLIEKYISCIVMDEFHQLFNYYNQFKPKNLLLLISRLNSLAKNCLLIGLTATKQPIEAYQFNNNDELNIKEVFSTNILEKLDRHFASVKKYYHSGWNMIKDTNWKAIKENRFKVLIYTDFISMEKKYKEYIEQFGLKAEWLCSPTNGKTYKDINENGEEVEIFEPMMTDEQMALRSYLIETNEMPEDLDVLIVNASYQTGWNLRDKDEKVQVVLVDSSAEDVHVQAVRVRHDIMSLGLKWSNVDANGKMLHKNGNVKQTYFFERGKDKFYYSNEYGESTSYDMEVVVPRINLPKEYIGVKLDNKKREEIVYKFGFAPAGKNKVSWIDVKKDLKSQGYIVENKSNNGLYIFEEGKEIKKDSKKVVKKMNETNKLYDWLLLEWDRIRIPINEVRDNLDFGRKTWDKIVKSDDFVKFCKANRIKVKSIPKMGKTLYFTTY